MGSSKKRVLIPEVHAGYYYNVASLITATLL